MMDESNGRHNGQYQQGSKDWHFIFVGGTADLEAKETGVESHKLLRRTTNEAYKPRNPVPATDPPESAAYVGQTEEDALQFPLAKTKAGDRVWITNFKERKGSSRLGELGIIPGAELEVISCITSGSVVVAIQGRHLGFGASTAAQILVTDNPDFGQQYKQDAIANAPTHLRDLPVGARGCVVGYDRAFLGYMGKLLAMGLQPGTAFTVIRHALFGHTVEIEVQGVTLSLRKPEADALCVEEVEE